MGMFDDGSYDPSNPNDQSEQYKKAGSDPFAEFGIMTPMQKQMQAMQMQNAYRQQQMQQQQQMLNLQATSANMGVNAAGISGLNGPMLQMMGGQQPAFEGKLTNAINQFLPGGGLNNGNGLGNPAPSGMTPMGPNAMAQQNMDPSALVSASLSAHPDDLAAGYADAAAKMKQVADAKGDAQSQQIAARLQIKAFQQRQLQNAQDATTTKAKADAARAQADTQKTVAEMGNPSNFEHVNMPNGDTAIAYVKHNDDGTFGGFGIGFQGKNKEYTLAETPSQAGKDIQDYRELTGNSLSTLNSLDTLNKGLAAGAAQGWTADGVTKVNNVVGTLKQLMPGTTIDQSAIDQANKFHSDGTFQGWANKTGVQESTWADLTMQLAKTYSNGGKTSNQDIVRAKEALGEDIGNPATVATVLSSVKDRVVKNVDRQHDLLNVSEAEPAAREQIDNIHKFFHSQVDPPQAAPKTNLPPVDAQGWTLHTDKHGNQAYVSQDGKQFHEVK